MQVSVIQMNRRFAVTIRTAQVDCRGFVQVPRRFVAELVEVLSIVLPSRDLPGLNIRSCLPVPFSVPVDSPPHLKSYLSFRECHVCQRTSQVRVLRIPLLELFNGTVKILDLLVMLTRPTCYPPIK